MNIHLLSSGQKNKMNNAIIAIYENGVLRPLTPLASLEHTRVQLQVQPVSTPPVDATEHRRQLHQALVVAGLSLTMPDARPMVSPLTAKERRELAQKISPPLGRPLSELIIEEREDR